MAAQRLEKASTGVYRVHARGCAEGSRCRCGRSYQARVYIAADDKSISKTFPSKREAELWRAEMIGAVDAGQVRAQRKRTVAEAADELVAGMEDGSVLNRSGKPYKPATVRSYRRALTLRVLPKLGHRKLGDVGPGDVQRFVEGLTRDGLDASTVRNTLDPLRVIFRRARQAREVLYDPTVDLIVPAAPRRRRTVSLSAQDAVSMVLALPESERALWAVAFFAGLRRGELRALRWSDVDLAAEPPTLRVERTWDDVEGELGEAKTEAGSRTVALPTMVARLLAEHGLTTGRAGEELVFGRTAELPFVPSTIRRRALKAWGEDRYLCTHQARHAAASFLIACPDVSDLELARTIGHSDVRTTKNVYGHLLPDSVARVAAGMNALLDQAATAG